jgi:hypothetical protein
MARKRGRPRLGKKASDHFNTRLDPRIKRALQRAAKRNDRTLSKEIQERLRASVETARIPTSQQAAELVDAVGEVLTVFLNAETKKDSDPPFDWRRHAFDREALKIAIGLALDQLGARGAPGPSRFSLFDTTPADAGRTAASAAAVMLKRRK